MAMRSAGILLILFAAAGCTPKPPAFPKTAPVSGTVLVKGKAYAGIQVAFNPLFDTGHYKFAPGGTTDRDGHFVLSSAKASDGAPPGEYAVTFTWPEPSKDPEEGDLKRDRWKNRYNDPAKSAWKVTIPESGGEVGPFKIE